MSRISIQPRPPQVIIVTIIVVPICRRWWLRGRRNGMGGSSFGLTGPGVFIFMDLPLRSLHCCLCFSSLLLSSSLSLLSGMAGDVKGRRDGRCKVSNFGLIGASSRALPARYHRLGDVDGDRGDGCC